MALPAPDEYVLLTAWQFRGLWAMPRLFRHTRRLEQQCRIAPGCLFVHRWLSKRSLLIESHWATQEAAEGWLASREFRRFDARARARGEVHTRRVITRVQGSEQ